MRAAEENRSLVECVHAWLETSVDVQTDATHPVRTPQPECVCAVLKRDGKGMFCGDQRSGMGSASATDGNGHCDETEVRELQSMFSESRKPASPSTLVSLHGCTSSVSVDDVRASPLALSRFNHWKVFCACANALTCRRDGRMHEFFSASRWRVAKTPLVQSYG